MVWFHYFFICLFVCFFLFRLLKILFQYFISMENIPDMKNSIKSNGLNMKNNIGEMQKSLVFLLQIGQIFVSTKWGRIITDRETFITKRDGNYKSGQIIELCAQNASIGIGSFLLTLKTITMNFEINIFAISSRTNSTDKSTLRSIRGCYQARTDVSLGTILLGQSHLFWRWDCPKRIVPKETWRNCHWCSDFLMKKQDQD